MAQRTPYTRLSSNQDISEVSKNVASRNRETDQKSNESYAGTKELPGT